MDKKYLDMFKDKVSKQTIVRIYREDTGSTAKQKTIIDGIVRQIRQENAKALLGEQVGDKSPELDVHLITGLTVQRDRKGNIVQFWTKTKPNTKIWQNDMLKAIRSMDFKYEVGEPIAPEECEDSLLEIPLFDLHFGISSYEGYNSHLRRIKRIITTYKRKKIIFVIGQDLLHNNDTKGNTANGTPIEKVDMYKAYKDALKFYIELLTLAQEYAEEVEVIYSKGNHDEGSSYFLTIALEEKFPGIKFDMSLADKKVRTFGKCFIGWSHSDKGKKNKPNTKDVRGVFSELFKMQWAMTNVRELHFGHLHHEKYRGNDAYGFMVRNLATANESDDWHVENDFVGSHRRFMLFEYTSEFLMTTHYIQ